MFGDVWDAGNLSYNLKSRPKWTPKAPEQKNVGIVVIGNYDDNKYVNKICTFSHTPSHVVLLQLKSFNHNVCMIGKK